jgi:hypothetical protein
MDAPFENIIKERRTRTEKKKEKEKENKVKYQPLKGLASHA